MLQLDGSGPLYQQIYRAFREEILTRALRPGERVPSTRALADLLKVSRTPAVLAYEQLLAEGYLEALVGAAGTVVASALPPDSLFSRSLKSPGLHRHTFRAAGARLSVAGERILRAARLGTDHWDLRPPHIRYDFRPCRPAFADLPYALWCRLLGSRARRASQRDLDHSPPEGRWELREAIANRLRRLRGVDARTERIVIVNGTQQALDLISRVLLNPGDRVLIEDPHYTGARSAFISAGAELIATTVDNDGIQIPKATTSKRSFRLSYVTPSHQFPTGVVLPIARRLELLHWASRVGAFVVEDDYDSEYRYDGPPLQALAGLDHEGRVIYAGTFSKILFPALRIGYLVLPRSLLKPIVTAKALGDTGTATLEQLALADFINQGHLDRYLRRSNASNAARRNALVGAVCKEFGERAEICGANAGLHVLVWLKGTSGGRIADVSGKAQMAGVGVHAVDSFYLKPPRRTGVVLAYAPLRDSEIREGIQRLAVALR